MDHFKEIKNALLDYLILLSIKKFQFCIITIKNSQQTCQQEQHHLAREDNGL